MRTPGLSDCFPPNLGRLRRQAGLSQEGLAHLSGLTRQYVGLLERGQKNPTLRTVDRIAEVLGVSPLELVRDAGH